MLRGAATGVALSTLLLAGCGGGGSSPGAERDAQQGGGAVPTDSSVPTAGSSCTGFCADTPTFLTADDVEQVIAQTVAEARARNVAGTVAVVDRVGNVLGVFRMDGAEPFVTVTSTADGSAPVVGGLEGVNIVPDTLAAIAKAITGAYLSTEGNAFTTRTASQIVQEHFNPGELNQPSGPLFGVQFSQLPCSDFVHRFEPGEAPGVGPHRSPLGLAADPGGLPLYKSGTAVGGVGFIGDGIYGIDRSVAGFDRDLDEVSALAGTVGFAPPTDRLGDVITVLGKTFRYTDWSVSELLTDAATVTPFDDLVAAGDGALVAVPGYHDAGTALAGTPFGHAASGIRPAAPGTLVDDEGNDLDAFVFVDENDVNRYPPSARDRHTRRRCGQRAHRGGGPQPAGERHRRGQSRAGPDPAAPGHVGPGDREYRGLGRRHPRHGPDAGRARVRRRRLAAEGTHRSVFLRDRSGRRSGSGGRAAGAAGSGLSGQRRGLRGAARRSTERTGRAGDAGTHLRPLRVGSAELHRRTRCPGVDRARRRLRRPLRRQPVAALLSGRHRCPRARPPVQAAGRMERVQRRAAAGPGLQRHHPARGLHARAGSGRGRQLYRQHRLRLQRRWFRQP
ncbi:MAG: hypothetical protein U5R48_01990 [Gammaproteobacteria bacterium]|nr:hypothetical protein [Gammaproteobacteria bacterium]